SASRPLRASPAPQRTDSDRRRTVPIGTDAQDRSAPATLPPAGAGALARGRASTSLRPFVPGPHWPDPVCTSRGQSSPSPRLPFRWFLFLHAVAVAFERIDLSGPKTTEQS